MKRLTKLAMFAVCALPIACDEMMTTENGNSLSLQSTAITFPYEGGAQNIVFEATEAWTISADQDWVLFSTESGSAGEATVTITVEANEGYDERTATVTLESGSLSSTIEITQSELTEFSSIMQYEIDYTAQTLDIAVSSNIDYTTTVAEDAQSWITITDTKAAPVASTISVNVRENTGLTPRSGRIYITAGDAVQCIEIIQNADFENLATGSATYIGSRMLIYDYENSVYTSFDEYVINLASEDGQTNVALAINLAKGESPLTATLDGDYIIDANGKHDVNTFSVNANELYHTAITEGEEAIIVEDGEISISSENGVYSITAVLIDSKDNTHSYSYIGQLEITDDSMGANATVMFNGQYYTYFASKTNRWEISLVTSRAPDENSTYYSSISFDIYGPAGDVNKDEIPVGTFTFSNPETLETGYANGNINAQANTVSGFGGYDIDGNSCEVTDGGTVIISKNDDGTYNFEFDIKVNSYVYGNDADGNWVRFEVGKFDYKATIPNVIIDNVSEGSMPIPNGDAVFDNPFSTQYSSLWFGDAYSTGNNVFTVGFVNMNYNYTIYITINAAQEFVFDINFGSRYCINPINDATFTYTTTPTSGANSIVPCSYSFIQNGYTGTRMYICGGSITLENGTIVYNLEAMEEATGNIYKFTGTHAATLYYHRDYSAARYATLVKLRIPAVTEATE